MSFNPFVTEDTDTFEIYKEDGKTIVGYVTVRQIDNGVWGYIQNFMPKTEEQIAEMQINFGALQSLLMNKLIVAMKFGDKENMKDYEVTAKAIASLHPFIGDQITAKIFELNPVLNGDEGNPTSNHTETK